MEQDVVEVVEYAVESSDAPVCHMEQDVEVVEYAVESSDAPWTYNIQEPACAQPLGARLVHVDDIRFTQRQVNDSFSHNMRPTMELIDGLLTKTITHRQVPLIRVAWHNKSFWSIDNRRLFCYKHCKLGRICVEVCDWDAHEEFDMKFRGGEQARPSAQGGHQAGLVQRLTDRQFPRSHVINVVESHVVLYMDDETQAKHDEQREQLKLVREKQNQFEDQLFLDSGKPWKYEVEILDSWYPATIIQASADGSFKLCVCREQKQFYYPAALPHQLRLAHNKGSFVLPPVENRCSTFIVPLEMRASLTQAWCALCGIVIGHGLRSHALRDHERAEHKARESYLCSTCGQSFSCSDDLRKHSRKKHHEIPEAFSRFLGGLSQLENHEEHHEEHDASKDDCCLLTADSEAVCGNDSSPPDCKEDTFVVVKGQSDHFPGSARCAICMAEFGNEKALKVHEQSCHKQDEFRCSGCPKSFTTSIDLRKHSRSTSHAIGIRFSPCGPPLCAAVKENVALHGAAPQEVMQKVFWLHVQSGRRLEQRCGSEVPADTGHLKPSLEHFNLYRYTDPDSEREYLWCPATQDTFFVDDAGASGWQREVWQKLD